MFNDQLENISYLHGNGPIFSPNNYELTNRNCSKVVNNKLIITYDRVPQWYPEDAKDFTTFQVILETSPWCG